MSVLPRILAIMLVAAAFAGVAKAFTFGNPRGPSGVTQLGEQASAQLNEAFALTYRMLAALERNRVDEANAIRREAIGKIKEASATYEKVLASVKAEPLRLRADAPDREILARFAQALAFDKLTMPKDKRELVQVTREDIEQLAKRMDTAPLGEFRSRPALAHDFIRAVLRVQGRQLTVSRIWEMAE